MADNHQGQGQDQEERGQVSPLEELTGVALPQIEGEEEAESSWRQSQEARHGSGVSLWFVVALLVAVVAAGYIILDGADDAVFAYTVDKAVEMKGELDGKRFRVRGKVQEGTIEATPGQLEMKFGIVHNDKLMTIAYDKPLPDTFKEGIEVIAEGELKGGVLVAENVIAKCPSKYEGGPPTAKGGPEAPEASH